MPPQAVDLTELLNAYLNKWVALSADRTKVIGSGVTLKEALDEALNKGVEDSVVTFVPAISSPHVL